MAEGAMNDSLVYLFGYYVFYLGGGNGDNLETTTTVLSVMQEMLLQYMVG